MKKLYIIFIILLLTILSCKNPNTPEDNNVLNNDITDYDGTKTEVDDNTVKNEYIDKKYPYWKDVKFTGFYVEDTIQTPTSITVAEKKHVLTALAFLRLLVNTDEFDDTIKKSERPFKSSIDFSYPSSPYSIVKGQAYDRDRFLDVLKNANYSVKYIKANHTDNKALANVRDSIYVLKGYKDDMQTGDFVKLPNKNWVTEFAYAQFLGPFAGVLLHEHLHNLGFNHKDGNDTPTDAQFSIFYLSGDILNDDGKLKSKYENNFKELKEHYFKKYEKWLESDTIYNPK